MTKSDVRAIVDALKELYPDSLCSLQYEKDYELLFAVRLSAQCTDERVNKVTPALYERFPTLESFAEADPEEVGQYIHSCGFFRGKSRDMVLCAQMLLSEYGGKVPDTMEDLLRLPGVGRKTANLILGDIHSTPGVVVADTHCIRISGRMGLTDGTKDPAKVEAQLRKILCAPPGRPNAASACAPPGAGTPIRSSRHRQSPVPVSGTGLLFVYRDVTALPAPGCPGRG